ncbi:DNA mismatch repair protein MutS [Chitinophaga terrae (ex Kim and Jung 2007)]|uniref:DNA mismatch repair protein MutS n=1 Tax=Chitinophaga terrae (ex Kim and Jung 2007) TaxID=408074 RepID=UPI00278AC04F|nr:DNA mismatch repair protein MutS [Chitinophaga terrae (ex Kim and Jung 2007)]MDQ0110362.1 DNA mismatch repair protein MutS [Chitinophaga terrae (ex Kim and Jung 2007)]
MAKSKSEETPLMQQHKAIKEKYPDAVLLFRVGDFYETFNEDAVIAASVLGIVLTKRANGSASYVDLAGFPHHALDTYLHKLVKAGHRVAVCDQLEDPKTVKGIVKRGVTEMVTPGVAINDKLLENSSNNFLGAIHFGGETNGVSFLDISTGEFFVAEGNLEYVDKLLQSFRPAEVIFAKPHQKHFKATFGNRFYTYTMDEWIFTTTYAEETLLKHFQTHSLKGYGVEGLPAAIIAAGATLHYLKDTEHPNLQHITRMQRINQDDFLWMDRFTIRNLELLNSSVEQGHTLLKVLDNTVTPMGGRLLKRWMAFPLRNINAINERLDTVEYFITHTDLSLQLVNLLKQCGDLERLVSKIPLRKINPREVMQLARSLQQVAAVKALLENSESNYLSRLNEKLDPCNPILDRILKEVVENPPVLVAKGGVIMEGVDTELDELRNIATKGKDYLLQIQQKESEATGIPSLKIAFNNVFGYYLEVTNTHKNKVPEGWIRKQTLANAERYITPELKEYEEKITGAEDKIQVIEARLFEELVQALQAYIQPIQQDAQVLARLDCLLCFAHNAVQYKYRRPVINEGYDLVIKDGRHPVIERGLPVGESYVANDLQLDKEQQQIIILTGPNMSGKSALLRQTALITLMAHMGSFVPASSAVIGLTDKIFTRVGASDNLSGGESTFMVEMNETASIINSITPRSLVILDEIGRGTSTYDGISIAWSIVEYLHDMTPHRPKTLFATHYHELNELENKHNRVKNFHITNMESGNKIIFLRKLAPGGSRHSFGIHVARMAGMPPELINRANEVLAQLEEKHIEAPLQENVKRLNTPTQKLQLNIFDAHSDTFQQIRAQLENVDINRLTPVEALLKLNEIKTILG